MPDPTSRIRFSSVFPKKAWIILCKTDPNSTWSGLGQTHLVWKQAGVQESSGPVSGRTQPARFQFATDVPDKIVQNRPDPIYFWLIMSGFGQTDPARKQAGVQESSGPLLANASQPIRTGCESDPACLPPDDGKASQPVSVPKLGRHNCCAFTGLEIITIVFQRR